MPVGPLAAVTVSGLTIRNGATTLSGGGIFNEGGTLNLVETVVSGNTTSADGGGI